MRKLRNKSIENEQEVLTSFFPKKTTKRTAVRAMSPAVFSQTGSAVATYETVPAAHKVSTGYPAKAKQSFSEYNLSLIKNCTTDFGVKQNHEGENINIYSLDDNAMALIIMCEHYEMTREKSDLELIGIYLKFMQYCLQPNGYFFKYVDVEKKFTQENKSVNLADTTGCAICALGYLISKKNILPLYLVEQAECMYQEALLGVKKIHSLNAIAYTIKGLYYFNTKNETIEGVWLIKQFANTLVQAFRDVENENWKWFQSNVAIESSLISEALLCAWLTTGEPAYREISKKSFDFLLSKIFSEEESTAYLEECMFERKKSLQINTLIFSLNTFYKVFKDESYVTKTKRAVEWLQWNKMMQF